MAKGIKVSEVEGFQSQGPNIIWVDPYKIEVDPEWNYRAIQEDKVEAYAKSMASMGFLSQKPLACILEGNHFLLREGQHRLLAACKVRQDNEGFKVAVILVDKNKAEGKQFVESMVSNYHAPDSPVERGEGFLYLNKIRGMSIKDISSFTGLGEATIKADMAIAESAGKVAKKAVSDKRITYETLEGIIKATGGDESKQETRVALAEEGAIQEEKGVKTLKEVQTFVQKTLGSANAPSIKDLEAVVTLAEDKLSPKQKAILASTTPQTKEVIIEGLKNKEVGKGKKEGAKAPKLTHMDTLAATKELLYQRAVQELEKKGLEAPDMLGAIASDSPLFQYFSPELQGDIKANEGEIEEESKRIAARSKPTPTAQPTTNGKPSGERVDSTGSGEDASTKENSLLISHFNKLLQNHSLARGLPSLVEMKASLRDCIEADNEMLVIFLWGVLAGKNVPGFPMLTPSNKSLTVGGREYNVTQP